MDCEREDRAIVKDDKNGIDESADKIMTVGQFLTMLRQETGLTQKQAADRLGLSNKTISRWETDRGLPDVDLLKKVADLYGVTVDELLDGRRTGSQSEAERTSALAANIKLIGTQFRKYSNVLAIAAVLGLIVYLWIYYWLNTGENVMSFTARRIIRWGYLFAWLGISMLGGFLIVRGLQNRVKELFSEDPRIHSQITEMVRCCGKRLCAGVLIVAVGLLPFALAREFRTYEKMMEVAEETYLKNGQEPMDEETAALMMEIFQTVWNTISREEVVQSLKDISDGTLIYTETYIQYLPMSICIGLLLWQVGLLFVQFRDQKQGTREIKKTEIGYLVILLAGVAFLLFVAYYLGPYYGDEKYPDHVTYEKESEFEAYVEAYFNTYEALRENSGQNMPEIWRGLTKIDYQYMDNAMPDHESFDRYRDVSGFDYETFTVYKYGNTMDWLDWMGRWNKVVFAAGMVMGGIFLILHPKTRAFISVRVKEQK